MKKLVMLCAVLVGVAPCFAGLGITHIQIDSLQSNGFTATYANGVINWTGGASLSFYNGSDTVLVLDNDIDLSASFSVMTDLSSGNVAKATFEVVSWDVSFAGVSLLNGSNVTNEIYTESEQVGRGGGTGILNGDAIVQVTGGLLTGGWSYNTDIYNWLDTLYDGAKMKSTIVVDPSFDSYNTQSYSSLNTTMWLYADETVVPEPATLAILGLGSLLVASRRRA